MLQSFVRHALRLAIGGFQQIRRSIWFVTRPRTYGAHAVALTPEGKVVLVKLRYARGWRLPGGGRKAHEDPAEAALRELREEIGLTRHASVEFASELDEHPDFKRDTASIFIVRDVEYRPRWSLEVEEVREADLHRLPSNMSPRALAWLAAVRPHL